jgi:release factor glutamine methyltransferase
LRTRKINLPGETASLDAQVLLAHILDKPRAWVLAHPEVELTTEQQGRLEDAVAHLQAGEPLPYVIGHWEFYGLDFRVTPDVLIPRPETEMLVEQALDWLQRHPDARTAIDVGTGSGCIAVSLAVHIPDLHLWATDISSAALQIARLNSEKHKATNRIEFMQADLLNPVRVESSTFDLQPAAHHLIIANLPYIPTGTLLSLAVYGKEPSLALDGGVDGLDLLRRLLSQAPAHLSPNGLLLLEIEHRQGPLVLAMAQKAFPEAKVGILKDLNGNDRIIRIENLEAGIVR